MYLREKDFFELWQKQQKPLLIMNQINQANSKTTYTLGFYINDEDEEDELVLLKSARRNKREFRTWEAVQKCIFRNVGKIDPIKLKIA